MRHAARIGGIGAHGHGEQVADAGFACVGAEIGDGFGGEALQPRIGVLERGAELRRGGIGARAECAEGLARRRSGRRVVAREQLCQSGDEVAVALAESGGGAFADERRPARETGEQLLGAAFS